MTGPACLLYTMIRKPYIMNMGAMPTVGVSVYGWRQVEVCGQMRLVEFSKEVREAQTVPFVGPYRMEPCMGVEDL
jgi:hypothetical protein